MRKRIRPDSNGEADFTVIVVYGAAENRESMNA